MRWSAKWREGGIQPLSHRFFFSTHMKLYWGRLNNSRVGKFSGRQTLFRTPHRIFRTPHCQKGLISMSWPGLTQLVPSWVEELAKLAPSWPKWWAINSDSKYLRIAPLGVPSWVSRWVPSWVSSWVPGWPKLAQTWPYVRLN